LSVDSEQDDNLFDNFPGRKILDLNFKSFLVPIQKKKKTEVKKAKGSVVRTARSDGSCC
jgi:hypothetical protein